MQKKAATMLPPKEIALRSAPLCFAGCGQTPRVTFLQRYQYLDSEQAEVIA